MCKTLKNFVKLRQNNKNVPVFPVSRSKLQLLLRFLKMLRRRASARLQLLEALTIGSEPNESPYMYCPGLLAGVNG